MSQFLQIHNLVFSRRKSWKLIHTIYHHYNTWLTVFELQSCNLNLLHFGGSEGGDDDDFIQMMMNPLLNMHKVLVFALMWSVHLLGFTPSAYTVFNNFNNHHRLFGSRIGNAHAKFASRHLAMTSAASAKADFKPEWFVNSDEHLQIPTYKRFKA